MQVGFAMLPLKMHPLRITKLSKTNSWSTH